MRQKLMEWLQRLESRAVLLARAERRDLREVLRILWVVVRRALWTALEVLVALVIVFEEWGWRPLADLLGRLARWRPWAAVEALIIRLPPYAALVVFVLPTALLLPLKFLALLLIAKGQIFLAALLFLAAKVVATALIARLFVLTQPALMQIEWFAWSYKAAMPWKDALTSRVRASWVWRMGHVVHERLRRATGAFVLRWRPAVQSVKPVLIAIAENVRGYGRSLIILVRERWETLR